jgi:DNA mismatch repair protein MutS2
MSFDIQTLEFHLQLEKLSKFAKNKMVQTSLLNLEILTNHASIMQSWQYTDEVLRLLRMYQGFPLSSYYDCSEIIKLIEKNHQLTNEEAWMLYLSLNDQQMMYNYIERVENKHQLELIVAHPIVDITDMYQSFMKVMDEEGFIKDDATPQLKTIRKKLKSIDSRYLKSLQDALSQYSSLLNENVIVSRGDALCLAVGDSYKNSIKGILHDVSQSKQTVYIEPFSAKNIRDEKMLLVEEEKLEIFKILKMLTSLIFSKSEMLQKQIQMLRVYDTFHAKAQFALQIKGNRPTISVEDFYLSDARHPEIQKGVVPITVYLNKNQKGLFISGSNTGGKTVTLKTIGLLHLMAQAGLYIPAHETSKVMVFEHIMADIGDQQSIEHNLSTFSAHLKKHQRMLEIANAHTLLLIDEIGSGTDPQEGVSIAQALLEAYEEKKACFVVTTHYQALKQFAIKKHYLNASVSFDQQSLQPTYHIEYGISGSSHAFDIATRLGIPPSIISHAKDHYASIQTDGEKLLKSLEQKEKQLKIEQQKLDVLHEDAIKLQQELTLALQSFEVLKKEKLNQFIADKDKEMKQKLEIIDQLLKDLKEKKQIPISQYATFKNIQQTILHEEKPVLEVNFNIGDAVYIQSYDQVGIIEKIKKDRYFVRVGGFEMEFMKEALAPRPIQEKPLHQNSLHAKTKSTSHTSKPASHYLFQLDLRGFRFDDVKPALDQAIDQAILGNQPTLRIIHGYGTGAVKKAVYDIIKQHPEIKSYRYGQEGEGLTGATIIYFK